jgi:hypothetical protein
MIRFNRWINKSHPEYFIEEDENKTLPTNVGGAVNVDKFLAAPTPDDFKNEAMMSGKEMIQAHADAANGIIKDLNQQWANARNPAQDPNKPNRITQKAEKFLLLTTMTGFVQEQHKRLVKFVNSRGFILVYYLKKIRDILQMLQKQVIKRQEENEKVHLYRKQYYMNIDAIASSVLDINNAKSAGEKFIATIGQQMSLNKNTKEVNDSNFLGLVLTRLEVFIDYENGGLSSPFEEIEREIKNKSGYIFDHNEIGNELSGIQDDVEEIESLFNEGIKNNLLIIPKNK